MTAEPLCVHMFCSLCFDVTSSYETIHTELSELGLLCQPKAFCKTASVSKPLCLCVNVFSVNLLVLED